MTGRNVLTEKDVKEAIAGGKKKINLLPGTIVTMLAEDLARSSGVEIVRTENPGSPAAGPPARQASPGGGRRVAFGSDHGGFHLKQALIAHAGSLGYEVLDVGTNSEEPCDYPDFAHAVAQAVADGRAWRGVAIDGAGIGSAVVANKVPGIRAACCHNEFVARNSREHNDANVLTLGSRVTGIEVCKEILNVWLESWFAGGRHKGRVDKISEVERRYLK